MKQKSLIPKPPQLAQLRATSAWKLTPASIKQQEPNKLTEDQFRHNLIVSQRHLKIEALLRLHVCAPISP